MSVSFFSVSLDCADAGKLADFWSQVLDRPVDEGGSQDFASIGMSGEGPGQPVWMFHRVPEGNAPLARVGSAVPLGSLLRREATDDPVTLAR